MLATAEEAGGVLTGEVVFGFVATAVMLAGFVGWTWHELRRVDEPAERRERRD
ncbi:MAG TPA: hypothetical protein VK923_10585 [Euzebyales bacterium]|nr:hypothetical protein [Euzebyales bacterium]